MDIKETISVNLTSSPSPTGRGGQGVRGCPDLRGGQGVRGCPDLRGIQEVRGCPDLRGGQRVRGILFSQGVKGISIRLMILCCLLFSNSLVFAQGYQIADTSKLWSTLLTGHGSWGVNYCGGTSFNKFVESEPGYQYLTVYESQDSLISWSPKGIIREDTLTKKVYFTYFEGWPEGLIYDFSIDTGDTVQVVNLLLYDSEPMVCHNIDTVDINGSLKRRFYFHIAGHDPGITCETWIEGIGSNYGIMNSGYGAAGIIGSTEDLLCCSQNGTVIWMDTSFSDCCINTFYPQFITQNFDTAYLNQYYEFFVEVDTGSAPAFELIGEFIPDGFSFDPSTGKLSGTPDQAGSFACIITAKNLQYGFMTDIIESEIVVALPIKVADNIRPQSFSIYPNPFTSSIYIDCPPNTFYTLQLYTPQGRLVMQFSSSSPAKRDLPDLTPGIYLAKVLDLSGHVLWSGRIVRL